MNLALGALIILILLLPALSFRIGIAAAKLPKIRVKKSRARIGVGNSNPGGISEAEFQKIKDTDEIERLVKHYFEERYARLIKFAGILNTLNFSETIFFFSLVPLVLHSVALLFLGLTNALFHLASASLEIDFLLLLKILVGKDGIQFQNDEFLWQLFQFMLYCTTLTILGYVAGRRLFKSTFIVKEVAKAIGKDNPWYRLFVDPFKDEALNKNIYFISVDALVGTSEGSLIYSGYMREFYFKPGTKELDSIVLETCSRRDLRRSHNMTKHGENEKRSYQTEFGDSLTLPGTYVVIPGAEILNIHAFYWTKTIVDNNDAMYQLMDGSTA